MFDAGKIRMKNYDDMLSRFHMVPERNGRTDRRTDRQTDLLYQYRASVCWRAIKKTQTSPVPRTETSPTFTRRRVREDTRARLHHDAPQLL